jgi:release factor glutamine methyltransferase
MWSKFYQQNEAQLKGLYPGLSLNRFLMEAKDYTAKVLDTDVEFDLAEHTLSDAQKSQIEQSFLSGIPFQYLLEKSEFFHNEFYVNKDVLIPRPETEYLVDIIVQDFKGKAKRVLDVGTGSGVILLSLLAHDTGKNGVGVDISEEALEVAKINRHRLRLDDKAELIKSDRLNNVTGTFDLIVSNPPYIKAHSHQHLVHESVNKHEPHQALYLPDDFYVFWFEDFFAEIRSHLKGTFFMEGHELELDEQGALLGRLGFKNVKVLKDLTGTKRYLRAEF